MIFLLYLLVDWYAHKCHYHTGNYSNFTEICTIRLNNNYMVTINYYTMTLEFM